MRHATVWAVQDVAGVDPIKVSNWANGTVACSWSSMTLGDELFGAGDAGALVGGRAATLPDCPTCAAFIDLALSIRAEEAQARINAEIDAERRKTA